VNAYSHSARLGARLSTTTLARKDRIRRALGDVLPLGKIPPIDQVEETDQASASVARIQGVRVLVSYTTAVAFESRQGITWATPYGQFSRTTDKSVRAFAGSSCERVELAEFHARLAEALE
jgi:hypothetical protein